MTIILEKKYIPLADYFNSASTPVITLTFSEIEQIMGQQLPNAAYLNRSWWKKTKPPAKHFHAWMDAGYYVANVETDQFVTFEKINLTEHERLNKGKGQEDVLLIRPAGHGDARSFINLRKIIEGESDFMLYGKDERIQSTQNVRKQIIDWKQHGHSTIFIAILNGEHVGYAMIIGNPAKRAAHRAEIVVAVQQNAQRKGIATALLKRAEEWSHSKGVSRLELSVADHNSNAIKLLGKTGYIKEGIRKNSLVIDEQPHDEFYMAKFL